MFYKKIIVIFTVLVFCFSIFAPIVADATVQTTNQTKTNSQPIQGYAYSTINISLDDSGIIYERNTNLQAPTGWNESIALFSAVMTLTTHGDILLDIEVEYNISSFPNFQDFELQTQHYKTDYGFLTTIVKVPITLLGVTSEAFLARNQSIYNPLTKKDEPKYTISQQVILRETTAFISALSEPFKFDNNFIELGSLHDFNFKVLYQKNVVNGKLTENYHEDLKLVSEGSPLTYVGSSKGYQGDIYFTDHQPEPLGNFPRQDVKQTIVYKFTLPSGQSIHLGYDPTYSNSLDNSNANTATISGSSFSLSFNTGDLLPNFISVSSDTPLLNQFSITDYASWALAILTGIVAILRGLPFYLQRRSTRGIRKNLRKLASQNKADAISKELVEAYNKYIGGKLSLNQYKSIKEESDALLNKNT